MQPLQALLLLCLAQAGTASMALQCLNGGTPSTERCICPTNFIGSTCETPAHLLSSLPTEGRLNDNYTYFTFVPPEVNFYKLNFTICMQTNPAQSPTLFFVSTQKVNGSLGSIPAFFQKFKLVLSENGCTNFSSHYINIKNHEDDAYRRVIVGMKTLPKNDTSPYFNVYKSQNLSPEEELLMTSGAMESRQTEQTLTIKMTYEAYLQTSYSGSFIVLLTSAVLMALFIVIVNYIRKKYNEEREDEILSLQEMYSDVRRFNNPEREIEEDKNSLTVLGAFMPATQYGVCSKYFVSQNLECRREEPDSYEAGQCCSICLVEFQPEDEVRTTPCRHRYHKSCIDNWCETNLSCPICRRALDFSKELRNIYYRYLRGEFSV